MFYIRFYGDPRVVSPPPDEARAQLCQTPRSTDDTCVGAPPWVITVAHNESWGYRVVTQFSDGSLALGEMVWEHGGPLQCPYHDAPTLEVSAGVLVLSVSWEGSEPVEVCEPKGCTVDDTNCDCYIDCHPPRKGVCELVLDVASLEITEKRGDCSGPARR